MASASLAIGRETGVPTAGANIVFERFDRDCGHNETVRAKGGNPRDLIRDFRVIINGEHRATLRRSVLRRGYEIFDADDRAIHAKDDYWLPKHIGQHCEKQDDFLQFVSDLLSAGRIPTIEKMAELREAEARAAAEQQAAEAEAARIARIRDAAPELLQALNGLCLAADALLAVNCATNRENTEDAIEKARDIISRIDSKG